MVRLATAGNMQDEFFLPWVESANDRRFKKILTIFVTVFILISVAVPFLPVAEIVQKDLKSVAPRLSRLIMEKKKLPPPPPPVAKKKVKKKPVKDKKKTEKKKKEAVKKAANSGLMALSNELLDLRESFDLDMLDKKPLVKSRGVEKQTFKTSIITASATTASSGINTKKLTRTTGGSALSGRTTTQVTSEIGDRVITAKRASAGGKTSLRDEREIEQIFQKNKGAIYSIYNRALRKDPTLEGKVVVELTISPAGRVVQCRVISSELDSPALERKIVARVKLFKFKASNVQQTIIKYPIDFLPS